MNSPKRPVSSSVLVVQTAVATWKVGGQKVHLGFPYFGPSRFVASPALVVVATHAPSEVSVFVRVGIECV